MKGLILAGGKGTRLRPLTFTRAKQLIPIANKPNLFYGIDDLVNAGINDIGVIISPDTGGEVKDAISAHYTSSISFTYIIQDEPNGLAHAVMTARDYLGDEPFVMYLGDNLLSGGIAHLVKEFEQGQCDCIVFITRVKDPSQFGVVVLDESGNVVRLIEKPTNPPSDFALVGIYIFNFKIHSVTTGLKPSARGEYEITDAIQALIDQGYAVKAYHVEGWWKDTGKPDDLLDANRLVLSQMKAEISGDIINSELNGEIVVEAGAKIINSTVRGPAHIASDAKIEDAYIGPYTSIWAGCHIKDSEVEFSILMDGARIDGIPNRIDSSIIGMGAEITGDKSRRNTIKLVLGDRSIVSL
jgi:glucose-1-phosphate thymidylyltransferase